MKIVYSYYVLDIIHKGHLLMMKNAKMLAGKDGILIAGILTDKAVMEKKEKPILSFDERMDIAQAIEYVDIVVPQETYSPFQNIINIRPDILVESTSHKKEDIESLHGCMADIGGKVIVMPYYPMRSSTEIKKEIRNQV